MSKISARSGASRFRPFRVQDARGTICVRGWFLLGSVVKAGFEASGLLISPINFSPKRTFSTGLLCDRAVPLQKRPPARRSAGTSRTGQVNKLRVRLIPTRRTFDSRHGLSTTSWFGSTRPSGAARRSEGRRFPRFIVATLAMAHRSRWPARGRAMTRRGRRDESSVPPVGIIGSPALARARPASHPPRFVTIRTCLRFRPRRRE